MGSAEKHFTFNSPRPQNFSLPSDVIKYLWNHPLTGDGLLKLYKTCKYFFSKRKILIIHRMKYSGKDLKLGGLSKVEQLKDETPSLWISRSLNIYYSKICKFENIYRFSMKNFSVYHSSLNFADYEILVAENTVSSVYFYDSDIRYSDGTNVSLDVILNKLSNIHQIFYKNDHERYFSTTLERMNAIKFKNKLSKISLDFKYLSGDFDPLLLCDFIRKNVTSTSKVELFIYDSDLNDLILTFKFCVESLLNSWEGEKPSIEFK